MTPNFIVVVVIIVRVEFPDDICKSILRQTEEVGEIILPGFSGLSCSFLDSV
jgi:hypothetical protein